MLITEQIIKEDIAEFNRRIADAQAALAELPGGQLPYPEHKKRKKKRKELTGEIQHINRLIDYAQEGLREMEAAQ